MKQSYLLLLLLTLPFGLFSQANWELGFNVSGANYLGDLNENWYPSANETRLGYGAFIKRNVSPTVGFRLNYGGGTISGDDANFESRKNRGMSFTTRVNEVSLLLDWDILGNKRYSDYTFQKRVSPYLFAGPGFVFYTPDTDYNADSDINSFYDERDLPSQTAQQVFSLNAGLGLRIDLSERSTLSFELSTHPVFDDWLDGVSFSGDSDDNDWFMFYGLSFAYRIGMKDQDKDGITDSADMCPDLPGTSDHKGCPDTDKDGIRDLDDACPTLAGSPFYKGCPDTDGDGITDDKDNCPNEAGLGGMNGCPDADNDGVIDSKDECPNLAGIDAFNGCPDTDKDGIEDRKDACPTLAGPANLNGCPFEDADGDLVPDKEDACPTQKGSKATKGCPDADNDGVADKDDRCPNVAGPAGSGGCPEMKKEDRETLAKISKSIQFQSNSDKLTPASLPVLDQIAQLLKQYPAYKVTIAGHTDSRGEVGPNQRMSEKRAAACRQYLIGKGIDAGRLRSVGYGESKPIASNINEAGRSQNRRVEFELSN